MIQKHILYFGKQSIMACDGRCDKAWGINNRPRLHFQESSIEPRALLKDEEPRNWDDYVHVGDNELGIAPADPGTYECDDGKPSAVPLTDSSRMNKWCARECERSAVVNDGESFVLPNMERPRPNIPRKTMSDTEQEIKSLEAQVDRCETEMRVAICAVNEAIAQHCQNNPLSDDVIDTLAKRARRPRGGFCCEQGRVWLRQHVDSIWTRVLNAWAYERLSCSEDRPEELREFEVKVRTLREDRDIILKFIKGGGAR